MAQKKSVTTGALFKRQLINTPIYAWTIEMRDPLFYCFLQSFLFFFPYITFSSKSVECRQMRFSRGEKKQKNSRNIIIFFFKRATYRWGGEKNKNKNKGKQKKEKRYLTFSITHHIFRQKWEIKFVNKTVLFTINTKFPFINMPQTRLRQIKLYLSVLERVGCYYWRFPPTITF